MKIKFILLFTLLLSLLHAQDAVQTELLEQDKTPALSVQEIITAYERNQIHRQSWMEAEMTIHDRFGSRSINMTVASQGREKSLIEFTSAAERGQKVLRTRNEIYLYYPDAVSIIRMQGAALRESMLGSDVSYEDMTGGRNILSDYQATLLDEELIHNRNCYKIELKARKRNLAYARQIIWIDSEYYSLAQVHGFAISGTMLKEISIDKTEIIAGKYIPTVMTIRDMLKKNSYTRLHMNEIDLLTPIDDDFFSLEELSW